MEVWKQIEGYENFYEVSNKGRVRSVDRIGIHAVHKKEFVKKGIILKPEEKSKLYPRVFLSKNNKVRTEYVHRLVAQAFLKRDKERNHINHKNGIKNDNRIENLEWCTQLENNEHGFKTGLLKHGQESNLSRLSKSDVLEIVRLKNQGVTIKELSEKYKVHKITIRRIFKKESWARETNLIQTQ